MDNRQDVELTISTLGICDQSVQGGLAVNCSQTDTNLTDVP
jgi:hypothetical protein